MNEYEMIEYLNTRTCGIAIDNFAEHVLRNYSFEERTALGASPIEQAYTVLRNNLHDYEGREKGY